LTNGAARQADVDLKRTVEFSKGAIVKHCFDRWRARLVDRLAWVEACRRSDEYSRKVQRERVPQSPVHDRKRRAVPGVSSVAPQRKRARKRVSSEYKQPHTDEELARRFKAVSAFQLPLKSDIDRMFLSESRGA
jgi:hypothetical protein